MSASADPIPRLHVLLSEAELAGAGLGWAADLLETGTSIAVHLRARLPARRLFAAAESLAARAAPGNWCVVNDRLDIAMASRAQAAQLGRRSLPVAEAVRLRGPGSGLRIGASVHGVAQAVSAVRAGADYLVLGTIYSTPSHERRPGAGPELVAAVRDAVNDAPVGVLAIGGIDNRRVPAVVGAGASGVVVHRAVCRAPDPVEAADEMGRVLETAMRRESERQEML